MTYEVKIEDELQAWIVNYMVTKGVHINPEVIISKAPQVLVVKIPNHEMLIDFLTNMETKGIISRYYMYNYSLTNDGLLAYRKFLNPLHQIAQDKKNYSIFLDKIQGTKDDKNSVKKLLEQIKELLLEQAYEVIVRFLTNTSTEAVYYVIRLLSEAGNSGAMPAG